ncbi:hypothetical protein TrLO_g2692 [Triparma laevis f. longispina]|uniref:DUF155 domain-containing protein n=1 Tax=Triparma laevis f. longispina TaxID=1714387 RepID=A0A9W6ZBG4_9STRA|nr:hypothetical protein TrLO_g2692 [Triparma laevis f. longispina]
MSNLEYGYGSMASVDDPDDVYDTVSDNDAGTTSYDDEGRSLLPSTPPSSRPPQSFNNGVGGGGATISHHRGVGVSSATTVLSPHRRLRHKGGTKHKTGRTRKNRSRSMSEGGLSGGDTFRRLSAYSAYAKFNLRKLIEGGLEVGDGGRWDFNMYGKDEVVHFFEEARGVDVFVYSYGCVVFWGMVKKEERSFIDYLGRAGGGEQKRTEEEMIECSDSFLFLVGLGEGGGGVGVGGGGGGGGGGALKIKNDKLYLNSGGEGLKLSLSFILAQSCNLFVFEDKLETTIADTKPFPESLQKTGEIGLSQNEIRKMMGRVYLERCEMLLYSDVLDTPEYLWYDDRYENSYQQMKEYLDFNVRIQNLHTRMQVLDDLLQLLNTLADSSHASHLEWIIIWLIVIEVVVQIGWNMIVKDLDAFGWFPRSEEDDMYE